MKGLYIPYWTFDAQVHAEWTAESGYYYYAPSLSAMLVSFTAQKNKANVTAQQDAAGDSAPEDRPGEPAPAGSEQDADKRDAEPKPLEGDNQAGLFDQDHQDGREAPRHHGRRGGADARRHTSRDPGQGYCFAGRTAPPELTSPRPRPRPGPGPWPGPVGGRGRPGPRPCPAARPPDPPRAPVLW